MIQLLRNFRFVILLLATFTSSIGTGITSITLPWYIIEQRGDKMLGLMMIIVTIVLFVLSPMIGAIVDRFSRKRVLITTQLFCGGIIGCFTLLGIYRASFSTFDLTAISLAGSLYFTLHIPTFNALVQELFDHSAYKKVNTAFEMLNQIDPIIAGALANFVLMKQDLSFILVLDVLSYLLSAVLIALLPYKSRQQEKTDQLKPAGWLHAMAEGLIYLRVRPRMFLFFFFSHMTFLIVMVGNFLIPVYIIKELLQPGSFFGVYNAVYAIGAVACGFIVVRLINRIGGFAALIGMMAVFTASLTGIFLLQQPGLFLLCSLFTGFSNAGAKIIRNTMMMNTIDSSYIGRVSSFYSTLGLLLRLLLLISFTTLVDQSGTLPLLGFVAVLSLISLTALIWIRHSSPLQEFLTSEPAVSEAKM
ncbi:MFS transporter [Paenibacillus sp. GCM10012307]|uniref:MFS transporter n=1 Tax=Paenibacillus roseus TaxID=2798579 RepID=A0A934IZR5_9BACL|nr:MFS transporter [Paenibacillus roseus]MBJ6360060.1 MFS transporter [Paenibacillus roseus]